MKRVIDPFKTRRSMSPKKAVDTLFQTGNAPKAARLKKLIAEAQSILQAIEDIKPLYRRLDEIVDEIQGAPIHKYGYELIDTFQGKATAWKSTPFRRFELKRIA